MSNKDLAVKETDTHPGWGELIEDAIGVNLRGLKTLWISIIAPARLFEAARTADWQDRSFSPTLRVWLFLLAILMFLQFIWATPESFFGRFITAFTEGQTPDNVLLSDPATLELALQKFIFIYPLLSLGLCICLAVIMHIWGKGTNIIERIRLFFAAILPSNLVTTITSVALAFQSENLALLSTSIVFIVIFAADFLTVNRGLQPIYSPLARSWRALLFAVSMQILYLITSLSTTIIMVLMVANDLGIATIFD